MWVIFAFCSHNSTGGVGNGLMAFFSPGWCSEWVAGGFFLVAGFFVCAVADCSLFSLFKYWDRHMIEVIHKSAKIFADIRLLSLCLSLSHSNYVYARTCGCICALSFVAGVAAA